MTRVLHVLDHSLPLHSGYTFRTRSILAAQRALGWETHHLTGPKQGKVSALQESAEGLVLKDLPECLPRFTNAPACGFENSHSSRSIARKPQECGHSEDQKCSRDCNPRGLIELLQYERQRQQQAKSRARVARTESPS